MSQYKVISLLAEKFPGVHFEYKAKRRTDDQEYLKMKEQSVVRRIIVKSLKRIWKNLVRTIMFWKVQSPGERFVTAPDETHLKYIRAEFWLHDELKWIYFMYLNLPIMITLFYGQY